MELTDYHGARIAVASAAEALNSDPAALTGCADIVRVERPPQDRWDDLRALGFVLKPQYVSWLARLGASEEEYLAAMAKRERQSLRIAVRQAAEAGLEVSVRALDECLLGEFLRLYEPAIAVMRHGVPVATQERDEIWEQREAYLAACAHDGDELVGCSLVRCEENAGVARLRFSAVARRLRDSSLARVLYLRAANAARAAGLSSFSLGKDRNLYGHIAQPGLLAFKLALGQSPQPSHLADPAVGYDQADLILRLGTLADPSMMLGYPDGRNPRDRLRLEVYSTTGAADIRALRRKLPDAVQHRLPGAERAGAQALSSSGRGTGHGV